jgi:hypothetical protein
LPTRVVESESDAITVRAPVHLCRRPEVGMKFSAVWDCTTGVARSAGVVQSQRRVPPTWILHFQGPIEHFVVEERYPDDSPGTLDLGEQRLPARIIDRSLHGVACVVPAVVRVERGQRVRVIVGRHEREGTVARVSNLGNQLRVGIRLDPV